MLLHKSVQLAFQTVKPVQNPVDVVVHIRSGDVLLGDFFAGSV
jgi:hypothetical protein